MENVTGNTGFNGGDFNTGESSGSAHPLIFDMMYFHGTTIDGNRFTIAGLVVNDNDLDLGIAICADGEQFSKERGRTISSGRVLNRRKTPNGHIMKSLYALPADSQFATENGMFVKDYFKGIEIKVFRDVVCEYNYCTKKELLKEFYLYNRQK